MKNKLESGILTLFPEGRIDSGNAESTEADINGIIAANPAEKLILDVENLEYLSSAGLRIVLRLRKKFADMKVVNASPEVYDIFDMTGFTEMLTVEKAYRKLSVEGCEVIGRGANGEVYRLDPDTIIKVYLNPNALPEIHRERELARKAFILGIPTAIPYDVVKVGEGYGSVFELLNAKSFAKLIIADPANAETCTKMSVELLKKIHSTLVKPGDMPDMKEVALDWASFLADYIPEDEAKKLYALVEAVPHNDHMMHGDYHIKNVMLQDGEVLLIDMDTLCVGDPVFEFASIWLAYQGYSEVDHQVVKDFLGIDREITTEIWKNTLRLYFGTEDEETLRRYEDKAKVIGYTRMMRRTIRRNGFNTEEGRAVIDNCKKNLSQLLKTIDSLSFNA